MTEARMLPSATQLRMARAALNLKMRGLGAAVGLSRTSICSYEQGNLQAISVTTLCRVVAFFEAQGVCFGPHDGVCVHPPVSHPGARRRQL